MFKRFSAALALTAAAASCQAVTLISENFGNVGGLVASGWVLSNLSSPVGSTGLFQGDATVLTAQAGAANSFLAANYNGAAPGGIVNELVVSPSFSTAAAGSISFWARADIVPGFTDTIRYAFHSGSSSDPAAFGYTTTVTLTGAWTPYTVNFAAAGAGSVGRFAIDYVGTFDTSNYIGIDSLMVTNVLPPVPEPSTWSLLGLGIAGLVAGTRRRLRKA